MTISGNPLIRVVIPSATWMRLTFWMNFAAGVLCILAGVLFGFAGFRTQAVLLVIGLFLIPIGWIGARSPSELTLPPWPRLSDSTAERRGREVEVVDLGTRTSGT